MRLPDGYHDVPLGKLANVQTSLEMHAPSPAISAPIGGTWNLTHVRRPSLERYRALFHRIGDDYLWSSRLTLDDETLRGILHDERVKLHVLERAGNDEGILELDFRESEICELKFFGVSAALRGSGAGRWLLNQATRLAWARPIRRFWVHTCSLDHPRALPLYLEAGFIPFKLEIEVMDDPRVTGIIRRDAAPWVPIIV